MANHQSIGLTLLSPESLVSSSTDDWLRLEQEPWQEPPDGGFLPWILSTGRGLSLETLQEYYAKFKSFCNEDGSLEVKIQVHKSRNDLNYAIHTSYGDLSEAFAETGETTISVEIDFQESYELDYNLVGNVSASWEGPVFDLDGNKIDPPKITQNGNVLSWGKKVVGVLRIKYSAQYDLYILTIVPREDYNVDNLETAYQSTVWAVWAGSNIEKLSVDLPDMNGNCSGGSENAGDDDDGEQKPCYEHYLLMHPCTKAKLVDKVYAVACSED